MKSKDILQYESANNNTILLITNKSVCRVFEVSAFWLSENTSVRDLHHKYSRSLDARMIYTWFPVRKLNKVLEELQVQGFHPVSQENGYVVLRKDGAALEGFNEWKEKVYDNVMVEQVHALEKAW